MSKDWTQQMVDAHQTRVLGKPVQREILEGVEREADLHADIIAECRRRGWQYLHGSMAAETSRTLGEPDFILMADGGRVFFIECKSRNGKLSPAQRDFKAHAERNRHEIHIVRSMRELIEIVGIDEGNPERK